MYVTCTSDKDGECLLNAREKDTAVVRHASQECRDPRLFVHMPPFWKGSSRRVVFGRNSAVIVAEFWLSGADRRPDRFEGKRSRFHLIALLGVTNVTLHTRFC